MTNNSTGECPNGGCDVCALGGDCRTYGNPSPAPPMRGLDFEKAGEEAIKNGFQYENAYVGEGCRKPLDRQLAERVRAAREEMGTPTMWWNTDEESWYDRKDFALDDLMGGKVYEIQTARQLPSFFVVRKYDEAQDEYIDHEFPTRAEAQAFLEAE